jgi:hypothetical protein
MTEERNMSEIKNKITSAAATAKDGIVATAEKLNHAGAPGRAEERARIARAGHKAKEAVHETAETAQEIAESVAEKAAHAAQEAANKVKGVGDTAKK